MLNTLKLLVVTPMTTSEAERSFSTLKRITTCLRSTVGKDGSNALSIHGIENSMIVKDMDFNKKVIDHLS